MAKQNNKIQEVFLSILDFCISNENIVNNTINKSDNNLLGIFNIKIINIPINTILKKTQNNFFNETILFIILLK